jgi:hypothetical protein
VAENIEAGAGGEIHTGDGNYVTILHNETSIVSEPILVIFHSFMGSQLNSSLISVVLYAKFNHFIPKNYNGVNNCQERFNYAFPILLKNKIFKRCQERFNSAFAILLKNIFF